MSVPAVAVAQTVPFADLGRLHHDVSGALERAWREALATSSFIGGERVERFEREWARYCGVGHAVGVANGTDAIELTLRALGIGPGDEVLVPANTFIATAEAVVLAGAEPRFVDVDRRTLLVTQDVIRGAISPRTAAVIAVALYGNMPAMDEIRSLADARGLALIEDAAQAHGSTWRGARAGSFGVAGCFSFYPGKNLGALGDGGSVVTNDAALAERIRLLANHGRPGGSHFHHEVVGRNSRLDALQAALLSAKLQMLDGWNEARRDAVRLYRALLDPELSPLVYVEPESVSTHHLNVVRVRNRRRVRAELAQFGIETGVHYPIPCNRHDPYRGYAPGPLPVVERAADEILSLPLFPHITDQQIEYVCSCLNAAVGKRNGDGN